MIEINGIPLMTTAMQVLEELKTQLAQSGIYLLDKIRPTYKNIQFTCPIHADGKERKPSCGISEDAVNRNGKVIPAGTVHCFTCGYTANIMEFVSTCFGKVDGGAYGYKWLIKNFASVELSDRQPLDLKLDRNIRRQRTQVGFIREVELDEYRQYHPYMYERKLTDDVITVFDVGYDHNTKCLTFPVCDPDGNVLFIQRRSVAGKFFKNAEDARKSDTVYGLHMVKKHFDKVSEVIICESIIDALTAWTHKCPAVALMGTGTEQQYKLLAELPVRKYVLAMDADKAGIAAAEKLRKYLNKSQLIFTVVMPVGVKDLNDLTWEQFHCLRYKLI